MNSSQRAHSVRKGRSERSRLASPVSASLLLGAFLASTVGKAQAESKPSKQQCARSYETAQEHRASGALTSTREELLLCSHESCPSFVKQDCGRWLVEVEKELPSFVVGAVNSDQTPIENVTLVLDGVPLPAPSVGKPVAVNPGPHKLEVVRNGTALASRTLLAQQGVQERDVQIIVPSATAALEFDSANLDQSSSLTPYAFAAWGLGAVGLGVFGVLGHMGRTDENSLREDCSGAGTANAECNLDRFNARKEDYRQLQSLADIGLITGIVGAVGGTALYLLSPNPSGGGNTASIELDLVTRPTGTALQLRGRF